MPETFNFKTILLSAYDVLSKSAGEFIAKSSTTKYTDWASLLTDIIAVSAALGALALPISLNVIEATKTRYKTPSLITIYKELSGVDPRNLNRHLFFALSLSLLFKLFILSNLIRNPFFIPLIFALTLYFICIISDLYSHLNFTYRLMSDIGGINNKLIEIIDHRFSPKTKKTFLKSTAGKFKTRLTGQKWPKISNTATILKTVLEIETYMLCTDFGKRDIDTRIRKAAYYQLEKIPNMEAKEFILQLTESLPKLMAEVESARELDIYQKATGLYLYTVQSALFKSPDFAHALEEVTRISRYREENLPLHGQLCRNGHIFLSCAVKDTTPETLNLFLEHFKNILWSAVYSAPELIPIILEKSRNLVFKLDLDTHSLGWDIANNVNELWASKSTREFTKAVESCSRGDMSVAELQERIRTEHLPQIMKYLKEAVTDENLLENKKMEIEKSLNKIYNQLILKTIHHAINLETLHAFGLLLDKSPKTIIDCRELINPAGASGYNIGKSAVPSSIGSCIYALISDRNYQHESIINEVLEYKIVDALAVLITYEFWRLYIFQPPTRNLMRNAVENANYLFTIAEIKSAISRIEILEKSFRKILSNPKIAERLSLLESNLYTLRKRSDLFCRLLKTTLKKHLTAKIKSQPLDKNTIQRLSNEITEDISASKLKLPLFKRIKIAPAVPFTRKINFKRESFLSDTGIYHMFDGIGHAVLADYHNYLCAQVLFHYKYSVNSSLPAANGRIILLTPESESVLLSQGFTIKDRHLHWPNSKFKLPLFSVNAEGSYYLPLYDTDCFINADFSESVKNLPVKISHEDREGEIEVHITFNFSTPNWKK
ncbi:hypothetical protein HNP29_000034 [Pseudomonas alcaligenes]|nr:hypothetical protein [Pseudomonas alcaligenes]